MSEHKNPNVIVVYADDLGYGDLSCYGAEDIHTPHIDALLEHGVQFLDGYSTSAVCTPARYSLLTGEYPFRNSKTYILPGDAACIIPKDKKTLPKVFKDAGYKTAIVGKWHLGLGDGNINWNKEIDHSPVDVGFDYSYIFPATNDRVPCVYLKNNMVVNLEENDPIKVAYTQDCPFDTIDTATKNPEKLRMVHSHGHDKSIVNGVGRIGYMTGGTKAIWKDEDLAENFLAEVKDFIYANKEKPFFLYYALHQPHVPRLPKPQFKGVSSLGPRGDVILELDWCVGEMVAHLKSLNLLEDTIIVFSSDNGPVLDDGYKDDAVSLNGAHLPAGALRGGKYSKFEGGARIPLIVSWKSHITRQKSTALVSQVDFFASFANMLKIDLADDEAIDSENMIDTLLGKSLVSRKEILAESVNKGTFLRQGKWTYLLPSDGPSINRHTNTELGNSLNHQLYNMTFDIGQRKNLAFYYPEIVKKMEARIHEIHTSTQTR